MAKQSRRELISRVKIQYQTATKKEKHKIINDVTAICQYDRKYAIRLLNAPPSVAGSASRTRRQKYDDEIKRALLNIWCAANQICSKRLVPFLPDLIENMENNLHIELSPRTRAALLTISPATVDRLLKPERRRIGKSVSTTRSGNLLKHQIKIRTFADWDDVVPGFFEADLVAHCGGDTRGQFLNTLVLIDVSTGWLEFMPLIQKGGGYVIEGLDVARELIPFPLLGIDTDNGSEFINHELIGYCRDGCITFTRSRAYKKNDQAYVEEKNGSVVRRMIGYDRYEGRVAWQTLCKLYRELRLYVNFFQPSLKLLDKHRNGAHVVRHYEPAQTPYQRVLGSALDPAIKCKLERQYRVLDAVKLLSTIHGLQRELQEQAVGEFQTKLETVDEYSLFYAKKTKKDGRKGPRHWRTRKDPFATVSDEIDQLLESEPSSSAASVLQELTDRYPRQFQPGHIRTLQRRVVEWRRQNAGRTKTLKHAMLH
ncbi:MAG: transposase [Pseudomonadota bacterium]